MLIFIVSLFLFQSPVRPLKWNISSLVSILAKINFESLRLIFTLVHATWNKEKSPRIFLNSQPEKLINSWKQPLLFFMLFRGQLCLFSTWNLKMVSIIYHVMRRAPELLDKSEVGHTNTEGKAQGNWTNCSAA